MQPIAKIRPPSFWSGLAALAYPFVDTSDYSRWACMLIERGHDGDSICALAGMEDEVNLFVLREWHQKAMLDLGVKFLGEADALAAHARGIMEGFLASYLTIEELLQKLFDLYNETWDARLEPFSELQYAWYSFEYADWGMKSIKEIPDRAKSECLAFVEKHQAEIAMNLDLHSFTLIEPNLAYFKHMSTREAARERAMELAMKYDEMEQVVSLLEAEGLGQLLEESELELIFMEAVMVRRMLPPRTKKTLPRVIGVIAILMGIAAIYIGSDGPSVRRYSPRGYGIMAIIFGVVLIVKPNLGKSNIE